MSITDIILTTPFLALAYALWQHNSMSSIARKAAARRCEELGVQLLDQNVILKNMSIRRSARSLFVFKRVFTFEFSSVGDYRYKGYISLLGSRVQDIELAAFKIE